MDEQKDEQKDEPKNERIAMLEKRVADLENLIHLILELKSRNVDLNKLTCKANNLEARLKTIF